MTIPVREILIFIYNREVESTKYFYSYKGSFVTKLKLYLSKSTIKKDKISDQYFSKQLALVSSFCCSHPVDEQ